jgi:hypothetical protein
VVAAGHPDGVSVQVVADDLQLTRHDGHVERAAAEGTA